MRERISSWSWGLVCIALGVIIAGNACKWWDIRLFFRGWWTMFIIIPCLITILSKGLGNFSAIGLAVGVLMLLNCQGVIIDETFRKLLIPVIIILIGVSILLKSILMDFHKVNVTYTKEDCHAVTFSGMTYVQPNEKYCGGELDSIFGSLTLDLRNAIIDENIIINATSIFGGIDIYVPNNVKVKINANSFFGGVSNKRKFAAPSGAPIVYINSTCMFGGVDIK
ncbi:MAG: LiaF-related protein [Clostridiales bacterium]|nr:LiaF-related protein [Clostridiales bacterium]